MFDTFLNMGNEKFCLRWNDFESNISIAFRELRDDKDFFDVTLACDDEQIQAHKVILSACSPFFRMVLRRNPHAHPLLYLKGIKFSDLQSVLNFMYHGEVNIAQEELNSFLAVAEELRVKGLTQNQSQSQSSSSSKDQYPAPPLLAPAPRAVEAPPGKRPRPPAPPEDDEIQEVAPPAVKTEPVAQQSSVGEYGAGAGYGGALQQVEEAAYEEEGWEDYTDYSGYGGAAVEAAPGDKGERVVVVVVVHQ